MLSPRFSNMSIPAKVSAISEQTNTPTSQPLATYQLPPPPRRRNTKHNMPFPSLTKSKPSPKTDTRPLLYAQSQSPSTPSLAPSSTSNSTANPTDASKPENDNENDADQDPNDALPMTRPSTPPQSTNHLPWSSYHNLPPDHPVFRYPDELREKMYAKGVGTCNPF